MSFLRFATSAAVAAAVASAAGKPGPGRKVTDDGEIVCAQWDGRTVPDVQWALDISRMSTSFRFKEVLKLQLLVPTRLGPVTTPTETAYEPHSRAYFASIPHNDSSGYLWGVTIGGDVNSSTPLTPQQPDQPKCVRACVRTRVCVRVRASPCARVCAFVHMCTCRPFALVIGIV